MTAADLAVPAVNAVTLAGALLTSEELRYTPGGIPVWQGSLRCRGEAEEAGRRRQLDFECPLISFGGVASGLGKLAPDSLIEVRGFVAPRSARGKRLLVHVTSFTVRS